MTDTTLQAQLLALMDKHNLNSISVGYIRSDETGVFPNVTAQGDGFVGTGGYSALGLAEALEGAILDLHMKRGGSVSVPELAPIMGVEA
jgi:hypothetical protein